MSFANLLEQELVSYSIREGKRGDRAASVEGSVSARLSRWLAAQLLSYAEELLLRIPECHRAAEMLRALAAAGWETRGKTPSPAPAPGLLGQPAPRLGTPQPLPSPQPSPSPPLLFKAGGYYSGFWRSFPSLALRCTSTCWQLGGRARLAGAGSGEKLLSGVCRGWDRFLRGIPASSPRLDILSPRSGKELPSWKVFFIIITIFRDHLERLYVNSSIYPHLASFPGWLHLWTSFLKKAPFPTVLS